MLSEDKRIEFLSHGISYSMNTPCIMGIVNATPDSFFSGSRIADSHWKTRVEDWVNIGCDILDIGGQSTRPGAARISPEEEWNRVKDVLDWIRKNYPQQIISIDTFYGSVAERAMEMGVQIINDVSAFQIDPSLLEVVNKWKVPYILMHMQGEPQTMQIQPHYQDVVREVEYFFQEKLLLLKDVPVWLDLGFGFGKTMEHNMILLKNLSHFLTFEKPLLVGLSRKKTIQTLTGKDAENCLPGTLAAQTIALLNGAHILRVHDVEEAIQISKIVREYQKF
jgi:dihydropteroate synthase